MPTILLIPTKTHGTIISPKPEKITTQDFPCKECEKIFTKKKYLNRHVRYLHCREYVTDCKECGKVFSKKSNLQKHIAVVHKGIMTYFQCDICGEKFTSKGSMQRHKDSIHLKQFNAVCDICGKGYVYQSELKKHIQMVHEKLETPLLVCPHLDCRKIFKTQGGLKYHEFAEHTENKPKLSCSQCGKTYTHPRRYKQHLWFHKKGPQIFPCTVCKKTLTSKESLQAHTRIHTGEKPYVCEHCGKAFNTSKNLVTHLVVHTKKKPFACKLCDSKYTQRGTLTRHIRLCHPD